MLLDAEHIVYVHGFTAGFFVEAISKYVQFSELLPPQLKETEK